MPTGGTNTTHTLQERYSSLVLAKIRQELVLKDGVIFNNDYEGSPKAGAVKIPVRDTEVAVSDYDKANGIEKASAELCGFAKTDILAPGASETVNIPLTRASCAPMMPTTPRPILLTLATTTSPLPPMHTTL